MAEALPEAGRYFCHSCSSEISPRLPEYTCPICESGFIEELPELRSTENSSNTSGTDQNRHPFEGLEQTQFSLPSGYGQVTFGIFNEGLEFPLFGTSGPGEENREGESRREQQSRHRYSARQPRARISTRRSAGRHEGVPTLEGIIQQLVNGIIAPTAMPNLGLGPWGVLHSNPMDYAWGANGLDTIITQAPIETVLHGAPSGLQFFDCEKGKQKNKGEKTFFFLTDTATVCDATKVEHITDGWVSWHDGSERHFGNTYQIYLCPWVKRCQSHPTAILPPQPTFVSKPPGLRAGGHGCPTTGLAPG
ncbi:E3 ubiquitin-protein ligase RNF126 isoform X2 [Ranitomeya variabilis]|uniref:E3 ubiquitin-protein ligase RNF126 isoform X2 n=1 Tax=Ranitomeya variabilis TaxID=490064 RepID=UPI0040570A6A